MEKRLLECGHTALLSKDSVGTWCDVCNDIRLVVEPADASASRA